MKTDQGVSIQQVQYSICKGTDFRPLRPMAEREAACRRYEEITGVQMEASNQHLVTYGSTAVVAVVLAAVIYGMYRRTARNKAATATNSRKSR